MVGIQIVSHGDLCSGILDSLEMIIGDVEKINCTKLKVDSDIEEYKEEMLAQSKALDCGQGVLVFADMYGATPYNTALFNSREFEEGHYKVVAGFNLPVLIDAVLNRETMSLDDLVENLKVSANESIVFPETVK